MDLYSVLSGIETDHVAINVQAGRHWVEVGVLENRRYCDVRPNFCVLKNDRRILFLKNPRL